MLGTSRRLPHSCKSRTWRRHPLRIENDFAEKFAYSDLRTKRRLNEIGALWRVLAIASALAIAASLFYLEFNYFQFKLIFFGGLFMPLVIAYLLGTFFWGIGRYRLNYSKLEPAERRRWWRCRPLIIAEQVGNLGAISLWLLIALSSADGVLLVYQLWLS